MRSLSASELLGILEWSRTRHPVERPLGLLWAAQDVASWDELLDLPVGERDARFLALRRELFGARLSSATSCPDCGAELEVDLPTELLLGDGGASSTDAAPPASIEVVHGEHRIELRAPTSRDVLAALARPSDERRRAILARLTTATRRGLEPVELDEVPEEALDAAERRLAELDRRGDVLLELSCPECATLWAAPFDAGAYLLLEVEARASALLGEVHQLARAYGWSEADILSMSAWRRARYLELVAS